MKKLIVVAFSCVAIAVSAVLFLRSGSSTRDLEPECKDQATIATCLAQWGADNITSLETVLSTLTEKTLNERNFADGCHPAWHTVGEAAGRIYPLEDALRPWAYSCAGGFMHGAISTAVFQGTVEDFSSKIATICEGYKTRPPVAYLDCWHGAGHGYAQVLEYPESMYACIPVSPNKEVFEWCAWGASEELVEPFQTDPSVRAKYEPRLRDLCTTLTAGQEACFRAVVPMMHISGWKFEEIYDYCSSLKKEYADFCAFSAGHVLGMSWMAGLISPTECSRHADLAVRCASGSGRYVGRLVEWGIYDAEIANKEYTDGICPEYEETLRSACQEAFNYIRSVELSPAEERAVTASWSSAG